MKINPTKILKFYLLQLCIGIILPLSLLADGPVQPEYTNFEPVSTSKMVNEFDGSFTYNIPVIEIPGPNGSGYALSLSYHSGLSQDDPASWVGWGWTLNPGSIIRNLRGLPDDYKNVTVKYYNKQEPNINVSAGFNIKYELFSVDYLSDSLTTSLGGNFTIRYNNRNGFSRVYGLGLDMLSISSLDVAFDEATSDVRFSYSNSPAKLLMPLINLGNIFNKFSDNKFNRYLQCYVNTMPGRVESSVLNGLSSYGNYSYFSSGKTSNSFGYSGVAYDFALALNAPLLFLPAGSEFGVNGSYSSIKMKDYNDVQAYGYLYSGDVHDDSEMMDYGVEKDQGFQERDEFLGIPFNNADNFIVTGEGISGGFRAYNEKVGHFRPNKNTSHIDIYNIGASYHGGTNIGVGLNLGGGYQELEIKNWDESNTNGFDFDSFSQKDMLEPVFFRFNNDLGGNVSFSKGNIYNENAQQSGITSTTSTNYKFDISSINNSNTLNNGKRSGRSSYISYRTNKEIFADASHPPFPPYVAEYTRDNTNYIDRSDPQIADQIGEFSVTNADGFTYVYSLPVYTRYEKSFQYKINTYNPVDSNYFTHQYCNPTTSDGLTGHEFDTPYATTYLLTAILSPDYSDQSFDGIDKNDLGGYTKFTYRRAAGGYNKSNSEDSLWYHWRTPYDGLNFTPNSLSDNRDDIGSFSSGEKEVYYLNTIETKTHFALFVTNMTDTTIQGYGVVKGSGIMRLDDYEAPNDDYACQEASNNDTLSIKSNKSERLEKILLFAKHDNNSKLIKTVKLNYDYDLCKNAPGTIKQNETLTGKLTLKNLWVDNENIHESKTSPYIFGYQYGSNNYPSSYTGFDNYGGGNLIENPNYDIFNTDRWGFYQYNGHLRYNDLINSVNQTPDPKFDPAAWHLKAITLPSQGSIQVQYEQNDYSFVQDRPAYYLVSLKSHDWANNKFTLDVEKNLGSMSTDQKEALVKILKQRFMGSNPELIYFKYLFSLIGSTPQLHDRLDRSSDYITGYVNVTSVDLVNNDIVIGLSNSKTPQKICKEYVGANRSGILDKSFNPSSDAGGIIALIGYIGKPFECDCNYLNDSLSYLRIPSIMPKKGGGVRVKRLLTLDAFDKKAENGALSPENRLYGKEYLYLNSDSSSSGVATYEPGLGHDENSLVYNFKKRKDETFGDKVLYGIDRDQFEGPLGESIMPAPSIGYSRVIVKDIFSGYTDNGFQIDNFYTTKDYPYDHYYSKLGVNGVSWTPVEKEHYTLNIPLGLYNLRNVSMAATQGYQFILYSINGKPKSIGTYGGNPLDSSTWHLTSSTEYEYFEPGEQIPVFSQFSKHDSAGILTAPHFDGRDFKYSTEPLGTEMDISIEDKKVEDYTYNNVLDFDASIGLALPVPPVFITLWGGVSQSTSILSTHITNKVIRYAPILKKVTNYAEGLYSVTENVDFDPNTGQPTVTRYTDGYDNLNLFHSGGTTYNHKGAYYSYSFPASEQYTAMGQKAFNERFYFKSSLSGFMCYVMKPGSNYYLNFIQSHDVYFDDWPSSNFAVGDLIKITDNNGLFIAYCNVKETYLHSLTIEPTITATVAQLDAIVISQAPVNIEIVKSGRTNQLSSQCGNLVNYGEGSGTRISGLEMPNKFGQFDMLVPTIGPLYVGYFITFWQGYYLSRKSIADAINTALHSGLSSIPSASYAVGLMDYRGSVACSSFDYHNLNIAYFGINDTFAIGYSENGINYYSKKFPRNGGSTQITIDRNDGSLGVLFGNDSLVKLNIFDWCVNPMPEFISENVIKASSTIYDSVNNDIISTNPFYNDYINNKYGKWKPRKDFVYYSSPDNDSVTFDTRVYENTCSLHDFELLNWKFPSIYESWLSNPWKRVNTNQKFNENGDIVEKVNSLGIVSATNYDNNNIFPNISYSNAPYGSVGFESFENLSGGTVSTKYAHTGLKSYYLGITPQQLLLNYITLSSFHDDGILVSFWLKTTYIRNSNDLSDSLFAYVQFLQPPLWNYSKFKISKISQTGEWSLYEGVIDTIVNSSHVNGDYFNIGLKNTQNLTNYPDSIWIDDFRAQPFSASCTSYVYDLDHMRLNAVLDDQHFAKLFQYTPEGKLNRMIIETEKGYKTLSETYYNTPQIDKSENMTVIFGVKPNNPSGTNLKDYLKPFDSKDYFNRISKPDKNNPNEPSGVNGKFNILDIHLNSDKKGIKLFDNNIDSISKAIKGQGNKIDYRFVTPDEKLKNKIDSLKIKPDKLNFQLPDSSDHFDNKVLNNNSSLIDSNAIKSINLYNGKVKILKMTEQTSSDFKPELKSHQKESKTK